MRRGVQRLTGIKVVTKADGRRYVYRRVAGQLIALPDLPENHPTFLAAYTKAGDAAPKTKTGTHPSGSIAALAVSYLSSGTFAAMAVSSRGVRRNVIDRIIKDRGAGLVKDLRPSHLRSDLKKFTRGSAQNRFKAWRAMLKHAVEDGLIETDPSIGVKVQTGTMKSHRQWTSAEISQFREYWEIGSPERTAFEVIYWTGARCVDAVRLGTQMLDGEGWLSFTQQKTGGPATCPVRSLPSWCASFAEDHRHLSSSLPTTRIQWIVTRTGKPRSVKGLSQWFSAAATTAGLADDCTAHGLRAARATALAEIGASTSQIGAWTGHASLSEIAHYTRSADQKKMLSGTEQNQKAGNRIAQFPKQPD